jgi:putative PIN family toxin of toxin-antitoxin system
MVSAFERRNQLIQITERVKICRDPTDDMFLDLAMSAQAAAIVSGDPDLLILHPFRGIPILTPTDFLKTFSA